MAEINLCNAFAEAVTSVEISFDASEPEASLRLAGPPIDPESLGALRQTDASRREFTRLLVADRHRRLKLADQLPKFRPGVEVLGRGALLLYEPDSSMYDGLAQDLSGGFFDVNNCPPSETWVAYWGVDRKWRLADGRVTSFLLAWIPSAATQFAAAGIYADPGGSITWADDRLVDEVLKSCR